MASSQYDIQLCSKTLVSDMHHVSELLVPGFGRPVLFCRGMRRRARWMAANVRDGYGAFRQPKFGCNCCGIIVFRVCVVRQNCYQGSHYRNPNLDDDRFLPLFILTLMAAVQANDVSASFLFVGDFNGHH